MPAPFTGPSVDPEHPWLGLHPFTEENQHYFFGRTAEIREIFLRVREQPLTVLYGQSGLGKTSLLRAGLLPKLRVERYRPVRLLLDFAPDSPPLVEQARRAFAEALAEGDVTADDLLARWTPLASLWEIFAREDTRPGGLAARPPVLIFDQFEEVFTLGADAPLGAGPGVIALPPRGRREEVTTLFHQLADLVEGRAPGALQQTLAADPRAALAYDFTPTPVRLVLALREDYLAQLEAWKSALPALMRNRMPLRLLSGPQALEAVVCPGRRKGRALVSEEVGAQIVRFVARRDKETPLEHIEAVPPLVSLLCERLNDARLTAAPPLAEITAALVEQQGSDILQRFYRESFEAFPDTEREAIRAWVEDRLVTVGGHRNPVAREDAIAELKESGVPAPEAALDTLIARRLLTAEQRGGIQRLEITHDVICPLVIAARNVRRAPKQRRWLNRLRIIALPVFVALATVYSGGDGGEAASKLFIIFYSIVWLGILNAILSKPLEARFLPPSRMGNAILFTLGQGLLLFLMVKFGGTGIDGSIGWQLVGLGGSACSSVGIGLILRRFSNSIGEALTTAGFVMFALLITSGFITPSRHMNPGFRVIATITPTFSAQAISDTSFLWKRKMMGDLMIDHGQSYRNLDPDHLYAFEVFDDPKPGAVSVLVLLLWTAAGVFVSSRSHSWRVGSGLSFLVLGALALGFAFYK